MKYVLIKRFAELTGYSEKAVRGKIAEGVWLPGRHHRKAPDGHILINLEAIDRWIEGQG